MVVGLALLYPEINFCFYTFVYVETLIPRQLMILAISNEEVKKEKILDSTFYFATLSFRFEVNKLYYNIPRSEPFFYETCFGFCWNNR